MLTRIGCDVKVVDLGCCYSDTFVDSTGYTTQYAAPEQLAGRKVDVRTDIYAVGKILELLPHHPIYNKVIKGAWIRILKTVIRLLRNYRKPYL